ncbi:hypothetical protein [Desulfovibrio inopinatus]|uniref:hypothetical protein n=1 Tax=Desulfovibrio inopinatus TaxID=102109 RepID=UPI0012EC90E5|nr:hypothetical protein [Desulfovibrio inopinatus]
MSRLFSACFVVVVCCIIALPSHAFRVVRAMGSLPVDREGMEAIHGQLVRTNLNASSTKVIVRMEKAKGQYECNVSVTAGVGTAVQGKTFHGTSVSPDTAACVELAVQNALQ